MELTFTEYLETAIWSAFAPNRYCMYHKRLEQGMSKRYAFKSTSDSTRKEVKAYLLEMAIEEAKRK